MSDDIRAQMRKVAEEKVWPTAQKSAKDPEIVKAFIDATEKARNTAAK